MSPKMYCTHQELKVTKDNAKLLAAIQNSTAQVAAGTCWLWARPEYFEAVDVLFVDEAGNKSHWLVQNRAGRHLQCRRVEPS